MNKEKSMTLIELMIVVVVIGLIVSIASLKIIPCRIQEARVKAAKAELDIFSMSLEMYRSDIGHYPPSAYGLEELAVNKSGEEKWNGPYLQLTTYTRRGGCKWKGRTYEEADVPLDPWGNEYYYGDANDVQTHYPDEYSPGCCAVVSLGADGEQGGEGWNKDIVRICIK